MKHLLNAVAPENQVKWHPFISAVVCKCSDTYKLKKISLIEFHSVYQIIQLINTHRVNMHIKLIMFENLLLDENRPFLLFNFYCSVKCLCVTHLFRAIFTMVVILYQKNIETFSDAEIHQHVIFLVIYW